MSEDTTIMHPDTHTSDGPTQRGFSRRRLLVGGAAGAAAVVLAACSDDKSTTTAAGGSTSSTTSDSSSTTSGAAAGDSAIATLAAGLEVLAVSTYKSALDAATAGKLGAVPPAVATYVKTAMGHHQEHLDAWNKVISTAGGTEITTPNAKLKPTVDAQFAKVTDVTGVANLALMLEQIAAQTYLAALPKLQSSEARTLACSIQTVDQQHQAILLFALGKYPVPEVFQKTDMAVTS